MSYWRDIECPSDPRDAYYEGRRSSEWERNPYEHGRDSWADANCREAHEEWGRGHRAAEYEREEQREQEAAEYRRQQRMAHEQQQEETYREERAYYEAMERQHYEQMEQEQRAAPETTEAGER